MSRGNVDLCIICFRATAGGTSRWAWLACENCRAVNESIESRWGFRPFALGRHSLMNGIGVRGGSPPEVQGGADRPARGVPERQSPPARVASPGILAVGEQLRPTRRYPTEGLAAGMGARQGAPRWTPSGDCWASCPSGRFETHVSGWIGFVEIARLSDRSNLRRRKRGIPLYQPAFPVPGRRQQLRHHTAQLLDFSCRGLHLKGMQVAGIAEPVPRKRGAVRGLGCVECPQDQQLTAGSRPRRSASRSAHRWSMISSSARRARNAAIRGDDPPVPARPGSAEPDRGARRHSSQRQHGLDGPFELSRLLHRDAGGFAVHGITEAQACGGVLAWHRATR